MDKPLIWFNNIFRYYIPEKFIYSQKDPFKSKNGIFQFFHIPDLLLISTGGNIIDFFSQSIFEDTVKEKSGNIQHLVELTSDLSRNVEEMYLSLRRTYAASDLELEKKRSLYQKLQNPGRN